MMYSERIDWPKIEITMLWSEICLLFTAQLWSNLFLLWTQELWSELLMISMVIIVFRHVTKRRMERGLLALPKIEITMLGSEFLLFGSLAWSNRFQVRDQEDAEQREARLADKRHHQAVVRFVYCLQPSFGQTI